MPQSTDRPALRPARRGPRPIAEFVRPCMDAALAKQGFGEADVLMRWSAIVGPLLAERCRPLKLRWQPRRSGAVDNAKADPATLVVRVEGTFAIMLQHMVPVVIERVNGHLGWRCVGKIVLQQGPLPPRAQRTRAVAPIDPLARREAFEAVGSLADRELKAALARLGSRVLSQKPRKGM